MYMYFFYYYFMYMYMYSMFTQRDLELCRGSLTESLKNDVLSIKNWQGLVKLTKIMLIQNTALQIFNWGLYFLKCTCTIILYGILNSKMQNTVIRVGFFFLTLDLADDVLLTSSLSDCSSPSVCFLSSFNNWKKN